MARGRTRVDGGRPPAGRAADLLIRRADGRLVELLDGRRPYA